MVKRKRDKQDEGARPDSAPGKHAKEVSHQAKAAASETIQIITGSYDRILHGFTATFDTSNLNDPHVQPEVSFADTFMFNAHSSAIRCLALSPLTSEAENAPTKLILASGGSDERINLYSLSGNAPSPAENKVSVEPSLSSVKRQETSRNRELGSLMHHSSTITQLCFAGRSKLLSSSEDNTIAVSRTRDWTVLSTLKAPMPKIFGRPSGDTAPPGGAPAGVNDFGIHPSKKLMISVGKGERTLRLWNLVTGKKGGEQDFKRDMLQAVGESKYSTGEARNILFAPDETNFVICFERGAAVFKLPFQVQGLLLPTPRTKLHKMRFLPGSKSNILAVSTDDGRILFFDTENFDEAVNGEESYRSCKLIAQLGGKDEGVARRVKSFQVIKIGGKDVAIVSACSDGSVRVWHLETSSLISSTPDSAQAGNAASETSSPKPIKQVGRLLGRYDTANRITCMEAFKMLSPVAPSRITTNGHGVIANDHGEHANTVDEEDEEEEFAGFD